MTKLNKKIIKLVTHNSSYHADDIFACASLLLLLEKKDLKYKIIRTRDSDIIKDGDFVFDVGGIYNPAKNRFDHHQTTFKEKRKNGITYSSFGLVWKKYGKIIGGSEETKKRIDERLVQPIDAGDNGISLYELNYDIKPYSISSFFSAFKPSWSEKQDYDKPFFDMVKIAKQVLKNEIKKEEDNIEGEKKFIGFYKKAKDKRVIVLNDRYPHTHLLFSYPKVLFVINPRPDKTWGLNAVKKNLGSFKNRKNLPKSWSGLRDEKLQKVTGVSDALFCHRALFLAVAKSKVGAVKLAEIALKN